MRNERVAKFSVRPKGRPTVTILQYKSKDRVQEQRAIHVNTTPTLQNILLELPRMHRDGVATVR